ncbi:MAG: restriction endonuclease [Boseongicola sp.]|nr:MAG: restriction endonuclease [Boseongicola sp.]
MEEINVHSNNLENIIIGTLGAKWNAQGTRILRYFIDFRHKVLNLHKELSAPELDILQNKVDALMASWDKKHLDLQARNQREAGKELAADMEAEAGARRDELRSILGATLNHDDTVDWDVLKSHEPFKVPPFAAPPGKPKDEPLPAEPQVGFFDRLFGGAKRKESEHAERCKKIRAANRQKQDEYKRKLNEWANRRLEFDAELQTQNAKYEARQRESNADVDRLQTAWVDGDPEAVIEHASLVLDASSYPDLIQKDYELAYNPEERTMVIEYQLPDPEQLPLAKTVRFVSTTGELKETSISQKEARELFDDVCYQICLRTIHELFEADTPGHFQNIAFNGVTNTINKATGNNVEAVIMSVLVGREEFLAINLERIEPKACFKTLKGVSAASLAGLAPVPPVLRMDKSDRRIVDARSIEIDHDGGTNLAAMDWEEFEHFVRELFEKEFASRGGEVKVTQSSSDGGVDAIAYDPDPITGGKIVIQAKRYTKTVGVSAVRDLYGTTLSEGASRGILVTTADYGPDAHKFCVDKPITLLNGANLLHLLEKHGIKATINLREARAAMGLAGATAGKK